MSEESTRLEKDLSGAQLERLLTVGRTIVSALDLEEVLRTVLDAARDLTEAQYAALGILDEGKHELERFVFVGIDEDKRHAIGPLPRGRGVLGELIRNPAPLRLTDVGAHQRSYGFPANHPPMRTFLGTPIVIRGEAWGNLYLTEKARGAEFTQADEDVAVVLAAWAAVAIENARLYTGLGQREADLARAVRVLEMSSDIARAGASGMGASDLLELVAKRARSLVDAGTAIVVVAEGEGFAVVGGAGDRATELAGRRLQWLADLGELTRGPLGDEDQEALIADLPFRGARSGALVALPRPDSAFDSQARRAFESFAVSAATTIASVRTAEAEKLRLSIESGEEERRRWARELHDETLQELGALHFLLESAAAVDDRRLREAVGRALSHSERAIQNLDRLITELRPATLDDLGIGPALSALIREMGQVGDATIDLTVSLAYEEERAPTRLARDLESAIYRLVQEAANNALKHGSPTRVKIDVREADDEVRLRIADDGQGFDPDAVTERFGLVGMRERVGLVGGRLQIDSAIGEGTVVTAEFPAIRADDRMQGTGNPAPS